MQSPVLAPPVHRGLGRAQQMNQLAQSGCNVFKCAGKVLECGALCYATGIASPACIACLGSAYNDCKSCF